MSAFEEQSSRRALRAHPRGGAWRVVARSSAGLALANQFGGPRPYLQAALWLVGPDDPIAVSRLPFDQLFCWAEGDRATLLIEDPERGARLKRLELAPEPALVPAGALFAIVAPRAESGFSLLRHSCGPGALLRDFAPARAPSLPPSIAGLFASALDR